MFEAAIDQACDNDIKPFSYFTLISQVHTLARVMTCIQYIISVTWHFSCYRWLDGYIVTNRQTHGRLNTSNLHEQLKYIHVHVYTFNISMIVLKLPLFVRINSENTYM